MRTEEEVALDEIHKAHNESFAAGRRAGILKGLRDAENQAPAPKWILTANQRSGYEQAVEDWRDAIDALIEQQESTNPPLTDDQARDVAEMHGGPETDAHIERLREENR